jgi:HlyD family secretion protein
VKVRYKLAPLSDTHTPARQEALIYQTVPVTRGALSQVVAATGTLNPVTADASQWRIEASVNEADVVGVEVGQDVRFTLDAFPGRTFTGKVLEVGNTPVRQDNTVNYTARITVNNPDPKFKPGMTANVAFIVAHRENVPRIPNAALRFRPAWGSTLPPGLQAKEPNLRIVYVMRAGAIDPTNGAPFTIGQPEAVRIRIGISDGVSTEVIEGLQEGDRVLIGIRRAEHSRAPRLEGLKERQSARCEDSLQAGESNRWSRRALPSPQVTRGEI